jgi:hypothetical protein
VERKRPERKPHNRQPHCASYAGPNHKIISINTIHTKTPNDHTVVETMRNYIFIGT